MNLGNFLKESNGTESSMRLLVAFITLSIMGTWTYVSFVKQALQPLDFPTVLALISSLLAKAWQKEKEEKI